MLSQALVAHTIELDNEAEQRLPHRTTREDDADARRGAPWLVSFTLWANVLQYLDSETTVAELCARARTARLLLGGLRRWGYVTMTPPAGETLKKPPQDGAVVRATDGGRQAREVFGPLPAAIDDRWRTRFGARAIDRLEYALRDIFDKLRIDPPAYLPVVYPTQNGKAAAPARPARAGAAAPLGAAGLSPLLSGVLLAFTLDFEAESRISLPICANTLRVLGASGTRIRDLPALTGVSREANAMCAGWLERHGCVVTEPDPTATRGKVLRLTEKGQRAQQKSRRILGTTEVSWRSTFGPAAVDDLRHALEPLVGDGRLASSPLDQGLDPYPDNWRAGIRQRPTTLPHYPMVLHRGGYPDGS